MIAQIVELNSTLKTIELEVDLRYEDEIEDKVGIFQVHHPSFHFTFKSVCFWSVNIFYGKNKS